MECQLFAPRAHALPSPRVLLVVSGPFAPAGLLDVLGWASRLVALRLPGVGALFWLAWPRVGPVLWARPACGPLPHQASRLSLNFCVFML